MYKFFSFCLLISITFFQGSVLASPSVGIGNGKIQVAEQVHAGSVISLPQLPVVNDGTSAGIFFIEVTNNEKQPQHKLSSEWITFSPRKFELGAGESQLIDIYLQIPTDADPGEYFGYVEASVRSDSGGTARVNSVSAAKLEFSVAPTKNVSKKQSNIQSDIYKLSTDGAINRIFASAAR